MRKANLDERFKAFMIDWLFWGVVALLIYFIVQLLTKDMKIIAPIVFPFAFWLWFKDLAGKGFGKTQMKLRIVNASSGEIITNPLLLMIRNMTIMLWFIDIPMLFIDGESRRLGEKITNTKVIKLGNAE